MKKYVLFAIAIMFAYSASAQNFEPEKLKKEDFQEVKAKVGGDFAIQLQMLDHESPIADTLIDLKNNFNLPTANLHIMADLAPGMRVYINNYMSSRHHNEAWVEGGYLQIDYLPFLPAADAIMENFTIRAGVMNPNYGDAHFYRSNNADVLHNPFVGNWIMDNYTTNPGLDILYRNNGILALVGVNNGRVNYGRGNDLGEDLVFNWKLGYDKNINEDLRVRATLSGIHAGEGHSGIYLWDGDRAGARYYNVMQTIGASDNYRSGRWSPGSGQSEMNTYMFNAFFGFKGLEVFGIYENMKGLKYGSDQHYTQSAIQALYHIGDFYLGTRYNKVSDNDGSDVTRMNFGGGWYMVDNVLVKLDYVTQEYNGPAHSDVVNGGKFSGMVIEAAISF